MTRRVCVQRPVKSGDKYVTNKLMWLIDRSNRCCWYVIIFREPVVRMWGLHKNVWCDRSPISAEYVLFFRWNSTIWMWGPDGQTCHYHDDVIKWKHFPRYWPFVRGIHRSPVNSPHKGPWRGALIFSLICTRINGWVYNGEAGDLRRHRAHYDVTVMTIQWRVTWASICLKSPTVGLFVQ